MATGVVGTGLCTGGALEESLSSVSSEDDEEDWGSGAVAWEGAEAENWGRMPMKAEPKVGELRVTD